jgi:hypothetical protein
MDISIGSRWVPGLKKKHDRRIYTVHQREREREREQRKEEKNRGA